MRDLLDELRHALRGLLKNPAVPAVAVLALGLGVGANTAIFSVIHGVLLDPLPYPEPDRLVVLVDANPEAGFPRFSSSPPDFLDWKSEASVFEHLAALTRNDLALTGGDAEPEQLRGFSVTAEFFDVFGVPPSRGRGFTEEDDRPGAPRVAVISQALWQRRFGADPEILGRPLILDGEATTVVGVAPEGFEFPSEAELWVPLALEITEDQRGAHWLRVYGRLRPGVSLGAAQTEMSTLARRLEESHPDSNTGWTVNVFRLSDLRVEDVRPALLVLMAAVGVVLLIACANVANVLLARHAVREREVAIRSALGAGRGRLLRQFLAESLLLAVAGGALGLLLAHWGTRALVAMNTQVLPRGADVGLDGPVLVFTLALALVTGLVFGLLPALHASRADLQGCLKEGGRGAGSGPRAHWARSVLVLAEVAMAVVLLVGAGLLLRSFVGLQRVPPGFDPEGVLTLRLSLPESRYEEEAEQAAFYEKLLARLRALPGVEHAGAVLPLPLSDGNWILTFTVEGRPIPGLNETPSAGIRFASPDYLETLAIPLLRGRRLSAADRQGAPRVAVINQAMARRMWPGADPLGERISFDDPESPEEMEWVEVVGVVGDVHHEALDVEPDMEIYLSLLQSPNRTASLTLRSAIGDPLQLARPVRQILRQVDEQLPVSRVQTLRALVERSMAGQRFNAALLGLFAVLALLLASLGVYGVISYAVAQRTREVGVRLALGADRADVLRLVVRQGMIPVVTGVLLGLLAAPFVSRGLEGLLYGVHATDPLIYAAVPSMLAAVGFLACLLPALRATRVDPLEALRQE